MVDNFELQSVSFVGSWMWQTWHMPCSTGTSWEILLLQRMLHVRTIHHLTTLTLGSKEDYHCCSKMYLFKFSEPTVEVVFQLSNVKHAGDYVMVCG